MIPVYSTVCIIHGISYSVPSLDNQSRFFCRFYVYVTVMYHTLLLKGLTWYVLAYSYSWDWDSIYVILLREGFFIVLLLRAVLCPPPGRPRLMSQRLRGTPFPLLYIPILLRSHSRVPGGNKSSLPYQQYNCLRK